MSAAKKPDEILPANVAVRFKRYLLSESWEFLVFGVLISILFVLLIWLAPNLGDGFGDLSRKKAGQTSLAGAKFECKEVGVILPSKETDQIVSDRGKIANDAGSKVSEEYAKSKKKNFFSEKDENSLVEALSARKKAVLDTLAVSHGKTDIEQLPPNIKTKAQELTANCIEEETELTGMFGMIYGDDETSTVAVNDYYLWTDAGERIKIYFKNEPKITPVSNIRVKLRGQKLDLNIILEDQNSLQEAGGENNVRGVVKAVDSLGERKIKSYLVYFQDTPKPADSEGVEAENFLINDVNSYYDEVSYKKVWATVEKSGGWRQIALNQSCDFAQIASAVRDLARKEGVDLNKSKHLAITAPMNCLRKAYGSNGVDTDSAIAGFDLRVSWFRLDAVASSYIHEIGHNLGTGHANFLNCGTTSFVSPDCTVEEYGDWYDMMGLVKGHMNAMRKDYFSWFETSNVVEAKTGIFSIEAIEMKTGGLKAVRVPRGGSDYLYIEYRQPIGQDAVFLTNPDTDVFDGVLLHIRQSDVQTMLVDPTATPNVSKLKPSLHVGQSIIDPFAAVRVTLLEKNANYAKIQLTSPNSPAPPVSVKGDVNCDAKIDSVDALLILRTVAAIGVSGTSCVGGGIDTNAADVDSDTDIDAVDALRVLQQVAGIRQIGSTAFNTGYSDSDGDQIADSQESQYPCMKPFLSDANGDYDGDSVSSFVKMRNIDEFAWGTNPCAKDTDGDGYNDGVEVWVQTDPKLRCGTDAWPADFNNDKKVTILDITSFAAPVRRLDTSLGNTAYSRRWDLVPGRGVFASDINIQDLTSVTTVAPPMLGEVRAMNGTACTP